MDRHQLRARMLKLTLATLALTSWVFLSSVLSTRPDQNMSADALVTLARLPASLPTQLPKQLPGVFASSHRTAQPIRMDVVPLPCWDRIREDQQTIEARWVRLTGRACQSSIGADRITVKNVTNGYLATVFATTGTPNYTTDFIPLQEGQNEILIRFNHGSGVTHESQFTFNRQ